MNREEVKQIVLEKLQQQIANIKEHIGSLTTDAQNDAKSSAGDKHETALAMMHLEQEKLNAKLAELLASEATVRKLPAQKTSDKATVGSVVKTNKAVFYISVAMPAVFVQNQTVMCVSAAAPLIQRILNKEAGTEIVFNNISYKIIEIY